MKSFEGKVAAVTGAGSGIGRELALEFARRGCHVAICCDRNMEGLQETADKARALGAEVTLERLDVSQRDAVYRWADKVVADHGKVNLLINNAGVELASTIEGVEIDDFKWLMDINFWGAVYGTKAFLPYLKEAGEGHIVNVSSVFGLVGVPSQGAYNSAKFALRGFTDSLREELDILDCGVSATSVHPGGIKTPIVRTGRISKSIRALGFDDTNFHEKFERGFITQADKAARKIIRAVEKNQRRALVGVDAYIYDAMARLFPGAYQPLIIAFTRMMLR
ncbi:MAG: SDR family NAD(P)-dependent oxidoreductase [Haliea sp.]|jgi:NAD(P)-dependent dehydrogenase (short-subunit alcohol dehydrogenase family)|nr:SDR family NAD(P)-dependent oxidoreductase [Haliea sp.]